MLQSGPAEAPEIDVAEKLKECRSCVENDPRGHLYINNVQKLQDLLDELSECTKLHPKDFQRIAEYREMLKVKNTNKTFVWLGSIRVRATDVKTLPADEPITEKPSVSPIPTVSSAIQASVNNIDLKKKGREKSDRDARRKIREQSVPLMEPELEISTDIIIADTTSLPQKQGKNGEGQQYILPLVLHEQAMPEPEVDLNSDHFMTLGKSLDLLSEAKSRIMQGLFHTIFENRTRLVLIIAELRQREDLSDTEAAQVRHLSGILIKDFKLRKESQKDVVRRQKIRGEMQKIINHVNRESIAKILTFKAVEEIIHDEDEPVIMEEENQVLHDDNNIDAEQNDFGESIQEIEDSSPNEHAKTARELRSLFADLVIGRIEYRDVPIVTADRLTLFMDSFPELDRVFDYFEQAASENDQTQTNDPLQAGLTLLNELVSEEGFPQNAANILRKLGYVQCGYNTRTGKPPDDTHVV